MTPAARPAEGGWPAAPWDGPFKDPAKNAADRARNAALLVDGNDQLSALSDAVDAALAVDRARREPAAPAAQLADREGVLAEGIAKGREEAVRQAAESERDRWVKALTDRSEAHYLEAREWEAKGDEDSQAAALECAIEALECVKAGIQARMDALPAPSAPVAQDGDAAAMKAGRLSVEAEHGPDKTAAPRASVGDDQDASKAWHAGAEAMRKACMQACLENDGEGHAVWPDGVDIAGEIGSLPLPPAPTPGAPA